MQAIPKIIKQYNIYFQDGGWAGICSEVELPDFMLKLDQYRGGGMDSSVSVDMGMEEPEVGFTMEEQAASIISKWRVNGIQGRFAAAMSDNTTVIPYTIAFTGTMHQLNLGNVVPGEKSPMKGKIKCTQISISQGGTQLIAIDLFGGTCSVGGVDILAALQQATQ